MRRLILAMSLVMAVSSSASAAGSACPVHRLLDEMTGLFPARPARGRGGLRTMALRERRLAGTRVRDDLAAVFVPLARETHRAFDGACERLDGLPRAGSDPAPARFRFGPVRWFYFRHHLPLPRSRLVVAKRQIVSKLSRDELRGAVQLGGGSLNDRVARRFIGMALNAPVGAYGDRLATAIVEAGRTLRGLYLQEATAAAANRATVAHADLLKDWTFQRSVLLSSLEGVQAFVAATAILTFHQAPGMDVPELLERIGEDRLLEQLAAAPLDFVGPIASQGILPRSVLAPQAAGHLAFSAEMRQLIDHAASERDHYNAQSAHHRATNRGCPLLKGCVEEGVSRSAITALGRDFLTLVRFHYERSAPPSRSP